MYLHPGLFFELPNHRLNGKFTGFDLAANGVPKAEVKRRLVLANQRYPGLVLREQKTGHGFDHFEPPNHSAGDPKSALSVHSLSAPAFSTSACILPMFASTPSRFENTCAST